MKGIFKRTPWLLPVAIFVASLSIAAVTSVFTTPVTVDSIYTLRHYPFTAYPRLYVASYYAGGNVGGGWFQQRSCASVSPTATDDGGSVIQDSKLNCFFREYQTGDVRTWGVVLDAHISTNPGKVTAATTNFCVETVDAPSGITADTTALVISGASTARATHATTIHSVGGACTAASGNPGTLVVLHDAPVLSTPQQVAIKFKSSTGGSGYAVGATPKATTTNSAWVVTTVNGSGRPTSAQITNCTYANTCLGNNVGQGQLISTSPSTEATTGGGNGDWVFQVKYGSTGYFAWGTDNYIQFNRQVQAAATSGIAPFVPCTAGKMGLGHYVALPINGPFPHGCDMNSEIVALGNSSGATGVGLLDRANTGGGNGGDLNGLYIEAFRLYDYAYRIAAGDNVKVENVFGSDGLVGDCEFGNSAGTDNTGFDTFKFPKCGTDTTLFPVAADRARFNFRAEQNGPHMRIDAWRFSGGGEACGYDTESQDVWNGGECFALVPAMISYGIEAETDIAIQGMQCGNCMVAAVLIDGQQVSVTDVHVQAADSYDSGQAGCLFTANSNNSKCSGVFSKGNFLASAHICQFAVGAGSNNICSQNPGSLLTMLLPPNLPGGRITLTSGRPVLVTDVSSSTLYYDSYVSGQVPVYYGGGWAQLTIGSDELVAGLSSSHVTTGNLYDAYVISVSGVATLCLQQWTTAPTSGLGGSRSGNSTIEPQDGVLTNKNALSNCWGGVSGTTDYVVSLGSIPAHQATFVGTLLATANGTSRVDFAPAVTAGGTNNIIGIWNTYNRAPITTLERDNSQHTLSSTTWVMADNGATGAGANNRISYVDGSLHGYSIFTASTKEPSSASANGGTQPQMGINCNSPSTTPAGLSTHASGQTVTIGYDVGCLPAVGESYAQAMESTSDQSASATFKSQLTMVGRGEY